MILRSKKATGELAKTVVESFGESFGSETAIKPIWNGRTLSEKTLKIHMDFEKPLQCLDQAYYQNIVDLWRLRHKSQVDGTPEPDVPTFSNKKQPWRVIGKELCSQAIAIAGTIIKHCPPNAWVYVPLGRGTTPVDIALEVMTSTEQGVICYLPFTRANSIPVSEQDGCYVNPTLSKEESERVFGHFRHFVPASECEGKQVLLFDFCVRGKSLYVVQSLMNDFFQREDGLCSQ